MNEADGEFSFCFFPFFLLVLFLFLLSEERREGGWSEGVRERERGARIAEGVRMEGMGERDGMCVCVCMGGEIVSILYLFVCVCVCLGGGVGVCACVQGYSVAWSALSLDSLQGPVYLGEFRLLCESLPLFFKWH